MPLKNFAPDLGRHWNINFLEWYKLAKIGSIRCTQAAKELAKKSIHSLGHREIAATTPEGLLVQVRENSLNLAQRTAKNTAKHGRDIARKTILFPSKFILHDASQINELEKLSAKIVAKVKHPLDCAANKLNLKHIFGLEVKDGIIRGIPQKRIDGLHHINKKMLTQHLGKKAVQEHIKAGKSFTLKNWCNTGKDLFVKIEKYWPETGIFQGRVKFEGIWSKTKTFFPVNWSEEKIVEKIWEAYQNPVGKIIWDKNKQVNILYA